MNNTRQIKRGWCGPCHMRCSILVHFENGRAVKVTEDPDNPLKLGGLCERGSLILEHLYHPDRLNYPLKRAKNKGENKWIKISWEDALGEISEKLIGLRDKYGAETLAFSHGTYRTTHWPGKRFYNLFGSPNMTGSNPICMCPSHTVEWATYGFMARGDMMNTACHVLWGNAPSESNPIPAFRGLSGAKKRGMKLIVVDPRKTKEAEMADLWLQIRPGTDLALMLGWINFIIKEGLYDSDFINNWTVGFDELKKVAEQYTPDRVEEITWIPRDKIIEGARLYATTKPATISWGLGIDEQGVNASQAVRARCILRAITGNIDIKGGELLGYSGDAGRIISDIELELNEALTPEQRKKQLGSHEYRLFGYPGWELIAEASKKMPEEYIKPPAADMTCIAHPRHVWNAIINQKPYPVKGLIVLAANPLVTAADTKLVYNALRSENLELVVVKDYYITPTAQFADYVLPSACTLERDDMVTNNPFYAMACPKVMEPLYERRDDFSFWRELGIRTGQGNYWPWKDIIELSNYRLSPLGITFDELVKRYAVEGKPEYERFRQYGFGTPSGKVELYSSIFEKLGYDPIPVYKEPPETPLSNPEMAKEFPLILISAGKFMPMYHSELRQIPSARNKWSEPVASIHPGTASQFGISEGDWIWIENSRGRIKQKAHLTDSVAETMVHIQHGWWLPEKPGNEPELYGLWESNANVLCPVEHKYCSPEIGSWPHTALLCRISKAV